SGSLPRRKSTPAFSALVPERYPNTQDPSTSCWAVFFGMLVHLPQEKSRRPMMNFPSCSCACAVDIATASASTANRSSWYMVLSADVLCARAHRPFQCDTVASFIMDFGSCSVAAYSTSFLPRTGSPHGLVLNQVAAGATGFCTDARNTCAFSTSGPSRITCPRSHRRCRTSRSDLGVRWPARLVATAAEDRLSIKRNARRRLRDRLAAADLLGHVFACLLWIVVIHLLWAWGMPSSAPSCLPQRPASGSL